MVNTGDDLRAENPGLGGIGGGGIERIEHRRGGRLNGGGVARMELEIAELPLDHEDAGLHIGVLDGDVGQRLDVEPGRDLDDLRGHIGARQRTAHPGAHVAQGLRLQLVEKNEGSELCHGLILQDRAEFFGDDRADLLAQVVLRQSAAACCVLGPRLARHTVRRRLGQWSRMMQSCQTRCIEDTFGALVPGNLGPVDQMLRADILSNRRPAEEACADGESGRKVGLKARTRPDCRAH